MLEAMKSLLGGSVGSYAPQQLQPQFDSNNQQKKGRPQEAENNPAVEITLSAQARRIMEALEKGDLVLDDEGKAQRDTNSQQLVVPDTQTDDSEDEEPLNSLDKIIKEIADNFEMEALSPEEIEKIDQLFGEITTTLKVAGAGESPRAETLGAAERLSEQDQLKAAILYSELNRLLGNVGVFFGRDLSMAKMTAAAQRSTTHLFNELSSTLDTEKVEKMSSPQAVRVDAIFRELEEIYAGARRNISETQSHQITDFFTKFGEETNAKLG